MKRRQSKHAGPTRIKWTHRFKGTGTVSLRIRQQDAQDPTPNFLTRKKHKTDIMTTTLTTWRQLLIVVGVVGALSTTSAFALSTQSLCGRSTKIPAVKAVKSYPFFSMGTSPQLLTTNSRLHVTKRPSSASSRRSSQRLLSSSVDSLQDEANKSKKSWSSKFIPSKSDDLTAIMSASMLVLLDVAFRKGFRHFAISFPSSLAGCGALLATLLVAPPNLASRLYDTLSPGSRLLAKWLSVFFVPSLITLPLLTGGAGSATEVRVSCMHRSLTLYPVIRNQKEMPSLSLATTRTHQTNNLFRLLFFLSQLAKVGLVVVGGFYFSLMSTAWSVAAVRNFLSNKRTKTESKSTLLATPVPGTATKPVGFSDNLHNRLLTASLVTGTGTLLASKFATGFEPYISSAFFLWTTLYTFVWGARLPKKITKLVHPLVTCTALTWAISYGLATLTSRPWKTILTSYRRGGGGAVTALLHPGIGAGDVLLFLLGPAVLSLACQMYERRQLVQSNAAAVATGVAVGSVGGLFGTAMAVRLLQIGNPYMRLSLLSRNITSPLAMAMAAMLGANVSLAVALVVVTGLLGANFGTAILDAHGVDDEIARGMAMGAASHGLGTAAIVNEKLAFPFSAISMALTASVCTVLVSIPVFQRILLQVTLGW